MVYHRKYLVIATFALTTAAASLGTFIAEPVFTATATLIVRYGREFIYRPEVGAPDSSKVFSLEEMVNSEVQVLGSRDLARQVIEKLGVEKIYPDLLAEGGEPEGILANAVAAFQDHLSITAVVESSIIKISFQHSSPAIASEVLNTLVEGFKDKHLEIFGESSSAFLQDQLEKNRHKLADAEKALQSFKQENGVYGLTRQKEEALIQRGQLQSDLRQTRFRIAELESQLKAFEGEGDGVPSPMRDSAFFQRNAALLEVRSKLTSLLQEADAKIAEAAQRLGGPKGAGGAGTVTAGTTGKATGKTSGKTGDGKADGKKSADAPVKQAAKVAVRKAETETTAEMGRPPRGNVEQFRSLDEAFIRLLDLEVKCLDAQKDYKDENRQVAALRNELSLVRKFIQDRGRYVERVMETGLQDELGALQARRKVIAGQIPRIEEELRSLVREERSARMRTISLELKTLIGKRDAVTAEIEALDGQVLDLDGKEKVLEQLQREVTMGERSFQRCAEKLEEARTTEELDKQKVVNVRVIEKAVPPVSPTGMGRRTKLFLGAIVGLIAGIGAAFVRELLVTDPRPVPGAKTGPPP